MTPGTNVIGHTGTVAWNTDGGVHEVPLPPGVPGRLWLCGKHVVGPDPAGVLQRLGASTIVCLVEPHELNARYPHYVEWLRAEQGHRAEWFPVHDLHAPDLAVARPFLDSLAERLREGDRLVVHCGAGIGRAGTTAVALLVLLGEPVEVALAHVRAHRPMAGPEVGGQLAFVHELARQITP